MKTALAVAIVILLGAAIFALRPICVEIPDQELLQFTSPIEQRIDRDVYLKVFQQRNGRWHQCKTWISRQLFF